MLICKRDILNGRLAQGSKLPSKRTLAKDNKISVRTVINAYEQLIAEGFITSEEKRGYFVAKIFEDSISEKKVIREVLTDYEKELVQKADYKGVKKLRHAIAEYLYRSRGMDVDEECVVIEAYVSTDANPLTDAAAQMAITMITQYLPKAVANGVYMKARDKMAYGQYLAAIRQLSSQVGIPQNLRSLGVKEEDFEAMAENAMKDVCQLTNPRKATKEQIVEIFKAAY